MIPGLAILVITAISAATGILIYTWPTKPDTLTKDEQ